MNTKEIVLSSTNPVLIAASNVNAYIQAIGGEFLFVFSDEKPQILGHNNVHTDTKLRLDGTLGNVWAWKKYSWKTKLVVSK